MERESRSLDWEEVEDALVSQWYFASKIMGRTIGPQFPYFTLAGIVEEIQKDPNFKGEEKDAD